MRLISLGRCRQRLLQHHHSQYRSLFCSLCLDDAFLQFARALPLAAASTDSVQRYLRQRIEKAPAGPSPTATRRATAVAISGARRKIAPGLRQNHCCTQLDGYTLTVESSLAIVERVLAGTMRTGFQTPSTVFGSDLILEIAGTIREDL